MSEPITFSNASDVEKNMIKLINNANNKIRIIVQSLNIKKDKFNSEEQYLTSLRNMTKFCSSETNRDNHISYVNKYLVRFNKQRNWIEREEKVLRDMKSILAKYNGQLDRMKSCTNAYKTRDYKL